MLLKHYDTCYGFTTYLFIGDKEETRNTFDKESLNDFVDSIQEKDSGLTLHIVVKGVDRYIIWMPEFNWLVENFVTLSHECGHVACMALEHREINDLQNDSAFHSFLYLKDSIYRELLYKLRKEDLKKQESEKVEEVKMESIVNPEEESTADYELKKELENTKNKSNKPSKNKKNQKKKKQIVN